MADLPAFKDSSLLEVRVLEHVGGRRGVFARVDLQPGQLLLREEPLITVPIDKPDEETLHMALARAVISHPAPQTLLSAMQHLHPTSLDALQPHVQDLVSSQHADDVDTLLRLTAAEGDTGPAQDTPAPVAPPGQPESTQGPGVPAASDSSERGGTRHAGVWTRDQLLRLLLVLRFNAHPSGLYAASEMFNHRCCPNAIKLAVNGVSEIRALKPIPQGTEVCISYLYPPLQSYEKRCELLQSQHFFAPSASEGYAEDMEAWSPEVLASLKDNLGHLQSQLRQLETQLEQLETEAAPACAVLSKVSRAAARTRCKVRGQQQKQSSTDTTADSAVSAATQALHRVAALLSATCAVRRHCASILHPRHLTLARTHELLVTLSTALLSAAADMPPPKPPKPGTEPQAPSSSWLPPETDITWSTPSDTAVDPTTTGTMTTTTATATSTTTTTVTATSTPESQPASSQAQGSNAPKHQTAQPLHGSGGVGARTSTQADTLDPPAVALLCLRACQELRATQALYAGPGHYDVVRTLQDTQQTLEYLLGAAPKRLYAAFPGNLGSFALVSKVVHQLHKEHTAQARLWQ